MAFLNSYANLNSTQANANVVTVTGGIALPSVANLTIGGTTSPNSVIQTDGTGNLAWTVFANTSSPTGPANAVQYNYGGVFTGDTGFTFNDAAGIFAVTNANITDINLTTTILQTTPRFADGEAGQYLGTSGANTLNWYFNGQGVGYPTNYTRLNTRVDVDTPAGNLDIDVTPTISIAANTVVRFASAYNFYKVLSSSTSGNLTTFNLDRPLAEPVLRNSLVDEVDITQLSDLQFAGVINTDYPPPSVDTSIGNVFTFRTSTLLAQNLHPSNAVPNGFSGMLYNNAGDYYSNTFFVNDATGALTGSLMTTTNITDIGGTLNINAPGQSLAAIQGNLNLNATVNGAGSGNLIINGNLTVNAAAYTPNDTSNIGITTGYAFYAMNGEQYSYSGQVKQITNFYQVDTGTSITGLTYNNSGNWNNYSGGDMMLLVTWTLPFSPDSPSDEGDTGSRASWLTIDSDQANNRYGFMSTNCTGSAWGGSLDLSNDYFGPTAYTSSAVILLPNNSLFQLYVWQDEYKDTGQITPNPGGIPINTADPQGGGVSITGQYNVNLGQTSSGFVYITRLD
jgi:hypothetical protein